MSTDGIFGDVFNVQASKGLNPGLIVLIVVVGMVLIFLGGNYALYTYAQRTLPRGRRRRFPRRK
ncbi:unnamed protein product [Spirodela intermedia]|uniref:Uncharacterized protein n=1 Tax=Spirodela intermedia TaxID=51605 RepID=A0A7I8IB25_SPIIN|nr:unnamed protein product [Spirodela intermedia]CAA6654780.1 unnamed protein product [Spirodela intermedia]